jgi:hypothetical protein
VLVACHHPLIGSGTRGGDKALAALAGAGVAAVLSGHVHDPFDLQRTIAGHAIRLIGAGTLSERLRGSRPSFNEIVAEDGALTVSARAMA